MRERCPLGGIRVCFITMASFTLSDWFLHPRRCRYLSVFISPRLCRNKRSFMMCIFSLHVLLLWLCWNGWTNRFSVLWFLFSTCVKFIKWILVSDHIKKCQFLHVQVNLVKSTFFQSNTKFGNKQYSPSKL